MYFLMKVELTGPLIVNRRNFWPIPATQKKQETKVIIIDCLIFQGNSGGPVLQVENSNFQKKFTIIGVVSQFVATVETWLNRNYNYSNSQVYNSGYSVVVPMDMVLELLN